MTDAHSFELGTDGPSAIVVGIDGSATSMRAGAYAAGLARRQRARLVAVYVGSVAPMCVTEPSAAAVLRMAHSEAFEQTAEDLRHEAEEKAGSMAFPLPSWLPGVTHWLSSTGSPGRAVPTPSWSGHPPRRVTSRGRSTSSTISVISFFVGS